jgi:hypothetical protein
MRSKSTRLIAIATAAVMGLTTFSITPASAAPVPKKQAQTAPDSVTDISAHRRYRRGNAAVVGAAAAIFGTIATIAAANAYRDRHRHHYYGYGPYYRPYYAPYAYAPHPYYHPYW